MALLINIAKETANSVNAGLGAGCLDRRDLANIILQRSEVLAGFQLKGTVNSSLARTRVQL